MGDLLTYRPEHFLLFSREVYFSLFADGNAWPFALAASLGLSAIVLYAVVVPRSVAAMRLACLLLAVAWVYLAVDYFAGRYAAINWAAFYLLPVAVLAAVVLLAVAILGGGQRGTEAAVAGTRWRGTIGLALAVTAIGLHPLWPLATGRPLTEAELVGLASDPTAILTCAVALVGLVSWRTLAVLIAPFVLLVVSLATLATMGVPEAFGVGLALVAIAVALAA